MLTCPLCAMTGALFLVVDILVGTQRQIFMVHAVQQAIDLHQLLFVFRWSMSCCVLVVKITVVIPQFAAR